MNIVLVPVSLALGGVLAVVAIVVAISKIAGTKRQEHDRLWQEAAQELGLRFHPKTLRKGRRLQGTIDDLPVVVQTVTESSGNSSQVYTSIRVEYPALGLWLKVTRRGALSRLTQVFKSNVVTTGDATFDDLLLLRSKRPEAAREFLTDWVRARLVEEFSSRRGLVVYDAAVVRKDRGRPKRSKQVVDATRAVVQLAQVMRARAGELEEESRRPRARTRSAKPQEELLPIPLFVPPAGEPAVVDAEQPPFDPATASAESEAWLASPPEIEEPTSSPTSDELFSETELSESIETVVEEPGSELPPAAPTPAPDATLPATSAERSNSEPTPAVSEPSSPSTEETLDLATVADDLFGQRRLPSAIDRRFREAYAGRFVRGRGTLVRVEGAFDSDRGQPIERGVLEIEAATGRAEGSKALFNVDVNGVRGIGVPCTIEGRLVGCDPVLQHLELDGPRLAEVTV